MKDNLSLVGAICLLIVTIVNFSTDNQLITGTVGGILFLFVLILNIKSRLDNKKANKK
ncbi:hypothetical protein QO009_002250 [Brevibacillus aydinogluensis]|jgi:hypothetical protein|uniref:Uncharacterized protein n=1 Tax=Brevibacillus aydinogluensis TaxID=927786 RepID=A0AA48RJ44_9BACL|nr:hypothetical protein [Brevibacillus aydinogluensis]CAJ1004168.1 hypothetical protein BSPP4475_17795 [Brevibacillus aydinogluensis]